MGYKQLLGWSLAPTVLLFLISLACVALTTHYWILGDWLIIRAIEVPDLRTLDPDNPSASLSWKVTIVEYLSASTDAAIVSSCLGMFAAIICLLAWYKLRRSDMDMDYNLPRRRFWVGFAFFGLVTSFVSALATLVLHYTEKGANGFGCDDGTDARGDRTVHCTREMGACKFIPDLKRIVEKEWGQKWDKPWALPLACSETLAVKWTQLVIMVICVVIMGMLGGQAWMRKKTRYQRVNRTNEKGKGIERNERSAFQM